MALSISHRINCIVNKYPFLIMIQSHHLPRLVQSHALGTPPTDELPDVLEWLLVIEGGNEKSPKYAGFKGKIKYQWWIF